MVKYVNLPEYIYQNLMVYGNTVIGEKYIERYGKEAILQRLNEFGFDCVIVENKWIYEDFRHQVTDYIIERKKDGK